MATACIIAAICILVWSSPIGLKFFAYCKSQKVICEISSDYLQISRAFRMQDKLPPSRSPFYSSTESSNWSCLGGLTRYVLMTTKKGVLSWPPWSKCCHIYFTPPYHFRRPASHFGNPPIRRWLNIFVNLVACGIMWSTHGGPSSFTQQLTHRNSQGGWLPCCALALLPSLWRI